MFIIEKIVRRIKSFSQKAVFGKNHKICERNPAKSDIWQKCTFCAGISERRSALQAHLRGVGVAGNRTAVLYADAAEFIGERKPFVQPCSGQTGQRGAVSTGGVQLPQKRPYKAIPAPVVSTALTGWQGAQPCAERV